MGLFDRLFGKKPMDASGTPLTSDMKALLASAKEAPWTMQEEAAKLREAIKKTWGVECQVLGAWGVR
jgi:hypothetical protein